MQLPSFSVPTVLQNTMILAVVLAFAGYLVTFLELRACWRSMT